MDGRDPVAGSCCAKACGLDAEMKKRPEGSASIRLRQCQHFHGSRPSVCCGAVQAFFWKNSSKLAQGILCSLGSQAHTTRLRISLPPRCTAPAIGMHCFRSRPLLPSECGWSDHHRAITTRYLSFWKDTFSQCTFSKATFFRGWRLWSVLFFAIHCKVARL
jgi:hypothetical protein